MGLELLALHLLGDFVLQTEHMALNKLTDWKVRLLHVSIYTLSFLAWGWWLHGASGLWFAAGVFATHFVIDSRRWCSDKWPPKPIIIDQSLHIIVLALLVRLCGIYA